MYILSYLQKYDKRAMVVQEAEVKHWKQLGVDFMTEESDDPTDPNAIVVHPLPWHSKSMNPFLTLHFIYFKISVGV